MADYSIQTVDKEDFLPFYFEYSENLASAKVLS